MGKQSRAGKRKELDGEVMDSGVIENDGWNKKNNDVEVVFLWTDWGKHHRSLMYVPWQHNGVLLSGWNRREGSKLHSFREFLHIRMNFLKLEFTIVEQNLCRRIEVQTLNLLVSENAHLTKPKFLIINQPTWISCFQPCMEYTLVFAQVVCSSVSNIIVSCLYLLCP